MRRYFCLATLFVLALFALGAKAQNWGVGTVFVGVGNGQFDVYTQQSANTYAASSISPLKIGTSGQQTGGCAFDGQFNFYGVNTGGQSVAQINLQDLSQTNIATPGVGPESIVFDASGNFYVGSAGNSVLMFTPNGPPSPDVFPSSSGSATISYNSPVTISISGSQADQIDLGTSQTNLFFASNKFGATGLLADTVTTLDLTNAAATTSSSKPASTPSIWAVRLLPPFDIQPPTKPMMPVTAINGMLVAADTAGALRLNSSGATVTTYTVGGEISFRYLALDPDGVSFWAGDFSSGNVYKFNIATGALEATISTGSKNRKKLGGICVAGGQQLNIVPLQFASSTTPQTAAFGDPDISATTGAPTIDPNNPPEPLSPNYHTWTATFSLTTTTHFTVVVTATEQGPQQVPIPTTSSLLLDRFDEYFCNQAQDFPNDFPNGCASPPLDKNGPTLVPMPYVHQMAAGPPDQIPPLIPTVSAVTLPSPVAGHRVVYRVQNPPDPIKQGTLTQLIVRFKQPPFCSSVAENGNTIISPTTPVTSLAANCYTPPQCAMNVFVNNPRLLLDPSEGPQPPDAAMNHSFAFDPTSGYLSDNGIIVGGGGRNDHVIADRCPSGTGNAGACFGSAVFNPPLPKATVTQGQSLPIKVYLTDCNGNPITNAISGGNNITVDVTGPDGSLEVATARSFDFFAQKGGAGGTYSGVLNTSNLQKGLTRLCVTSVQTSATTTNAGQFQPVCTQFTVQ